MALVARLEQKEAMERLYQSDHAEFMALYGRRRIGKTFLVKHFFQEKACIFLHVTGIQGGDTGQQMERFIKVIGEAFYNGAPLKFEENWFAIFDLLVDTLNRHVDQNKKVVLFLDEFPWMVTHKSRLLQALDHFWNRYWSDDARVKLIICGSSASWIIRNLIDNRGGLHNRVTYRMLLKPFTLLETQQYLLSKKIKLNHWHLTQVYMATGGVPFYLSFINPGQSSAQIIEHLAFKEDAPLLKEFDRLFASLFHDAGPYIDLLRILAKHRYGLSITQIANQATSFSKGGQLSSKLEALEEAGFILRFKPHGHLKKGVYYRVIDEYTLFYFYWIEPITGSLSTLSLEGGYWQQLQNSASWHSWSGLAFEAIVYKHISQVRRALNIPVTALANSWRYVPTASAKKKDEQLQGAQIDLLFDRHDDAVTLCEIKSTKDRFVVDKKMAKELVRKRDIFVKQTKTQKQLFIALISAKGMRDSLYSDDLIQGVVTLDDLFAK